MNPVQITENVLRDGHQSKIATRMRTEDMLPICRKLDQVGFWSLEVWGGATFDACLRFLKEDPWERLRALRQALPNTRLQMLLRGQNLLGYRHYADDVAHSFVRRAAANGVDVFRIFDALNDGRNLATAIAAVKEAGKHAQGTICYTVSPVHNTAGFVEMGREMVAMGCDSIAIKDMAGLLTPSATVELVTALQQAVAVPLHLHSHATSGLAAIAQYQAVGHGCLHIDTTISAFADGTAHPATETMVAAFRDSDFDTGLDLELLQEIGFYFAAVRRKYHQFESEFTGLDTRVHSNQIPGGMISNLSNQLREQGALDKMAQVLEEIPRVREDLGFPPLVTPTSQIVGTQALLNVLGGSRYKSITNEVKLYFKGQYGRAPAEVNTLIREQAIGTDTVETARPADKLGHEMEALRREIGELARTEEDALTYAMFPEVGRQYLEQRATGALQAEPLLPPPGEDHDMAAAPVEFSISLHGESYHVKVTGVGHREKAERPFYLTVDGVPEEILVQALEEIEPGATPGQGAAAPVGGLPRATQKGHVTTSMPGTVVEVLVQEGDQVNAGDPVLVTEAMKMETEIQAPVSGMVRAINIAKGDAVNPDDALIEIA